MLHEHWLHWYAWRDCIEKLTTDYFLLQIEKRKTLAIFLLYLFSYDSINSAMRLKRIIDASIEALRREKDLPDNVMIDKKYSIEEFEH